MTVSVNDLSRIITVERMAFILSNRPEARGPTAVRQTDGGQVLWANRGMNVESAFGGQVLKVEVGGRLPRWAPKGQGPSQ